MGIVSNFTVYGLMILPLAMLLRGRSISVTRLVLLSVATVIVQFAESIIRASFVCSEGGCPLAAALVDGALLPMIQACFFSFVLCDAKAAKLFNLEAAVTEPEPTADPATGEKVVSVGKGGDTAAAVATVWCLCFIVFFRWGEWYRNMNSLGYEPATAQSGLEAFFQLLATLGACRALLGSGGSWFVAGTIVAAHFSAAVAALAIGRTLPMAAASATLYVMGNPTLNRLVGFAKVDKKDRKN